MRFAVVLLPISLALFAPRVHAQDTPTMVEDAKPPPPVRPFAAVTNAEPMHWYGGQILVADLGAFGTMGIAAGTGAPWLGVLGVSAFLLTPMIIHGVHEQGGRAAGSLALRLLLPASFAAIGYGIGHQPDKPCTQRPGQYIDLCLNLNFSGLAEGFVGAVTASMIDTFGLAYEPGKKTAPVASFELGVRPVRGGTVLVLGRAF